jgi:hypothetical protein
MQGVIGTGKMAVPVTIRGEMDTVFGKACMIFDMGRRDPGRP